MIFSKKKTNGNAIENEITALVERKAKLADRLSQARANAEAALTSRRSFLLSDNVGDDKARREIDNQVLAVQGEETGLCDAIAQLDLQITSARQRLEQERHHVECAAIAKEFTTKADTLERKLEIWRIAGVEMCEHLFTVPGPGIDAGFPERMKALCRELPVTVAQVVEQARAHARAVEATPLPVAPVPTPAPKVDERSTGLFHRYADLPHDKIPHEDVFKDFKATRVV